MSAYRQAHDTTVTLRREMRLRITAQCESSSNFENCVKDEVTMGFNSVVKNITPQNFKAQVKTYLLDLSIKSTIDGIIDSCYTNKREFYSCYLNGLKRNCPELQGFVDATLELAPYYFA
uniref:Uncharacterized protein n=1 Tax=Strigamia maritima TaxID=126957 RepID=T1IX21_STRMM